MLNCPFSKFELWCCKLNLWFHNLEMIPQLGVDLQLDSQLGGHFAANGQFCGHFVPKEYFCRPFCNPFRSFEMRGWSCEMALVCQGVVLQLWNHLRNFRNSFRSTLCNCLQTAITSSFKFRFTHPLKRWTPDFPRFEKTYSMHEMDFRKWSKCVLQMLSSWILHVRFLFFSSLHSWLALAKNYEAPKLEFFI